MTLIISNDDVARVLTMKDTIAVLEKAYAGLVAKETVCRPRIDMQIPTSDPKKVYQWGTMEGGSAGGYFAIRMKSDVVTETEYRGVRTQEKYCSRPGLYCGLILLTSVETGEPLAFLNDGYLQHMRVGADGGIGVKYMAREDARVVGMLGSGGMARSHMDAFMCVRPIRRLKAFSPTRANREAYATEMRERHGIEVEVCDTAREVYRGVDILAGCTDSAVPVIEAEWLEPGTHVLNVGGGSGIPSREAMERMDVYFRFGNAPAPWGLPEMAIADEHITYAARPDHDYGFRMKRPGSRGHGVALPDRMVTMADILNGTNRGRTARSQITYSERGNLQGAQFFAVAGLAYEKAKEQGFGREIPTEWLLQDIRD
jgi:ornithine cyclodeaminase/alanine dehydrogenase-like protein (mu-crystallin family)